MFCSNCGSPNDDNSKFCTKCSSPLQASAAPLGQKPPAAKKKTLRTVVITIVCLIVAFVLWVEFSPDEAASDSNITTTAITTTANTAALEVTDAPIDATQPAETTAVPTLAPVATTNAAILTAANTAEEALTLVRQLTGLTSNAEFYREEDFIFNNDGTLSIDVNTPELATATCFIICENGYAGDGYDNCFIVLKGTDQIYTAQAGGTGIMEQIH